MLTKAETSRLRGLREKKARAAAGRYVIENPKVVAELLVAGVEVLELYVTAEWVTPPGVSHPELRVISVQEMERISHLPTPSTVFAVGVMRARVLQPGELSRGRTLALDGMQDPGNVGTLLRIADWFGFDRVLLSPDCADLFSQKVISASMGSFVRIKTCVVPLAATLTDVRVPILGCDLAGDDVQQLRPMVDVVVVIGSEGRGLSADVSACLTQRVTIPRFGGAESLNAAVAAGIVCARLRATG